MHFRSLIRAFLVALLATSGCGDSDGHDGDGHHNDPVQCSSDTGDGGVWLRCGDASVRVPEGPPGEDGTSCTVDTEANGDVVIRCDDGSSVTVPAGSDGTDGVDGEPGPVGPPGAGAHATGPGLVIELKAASIGSDRRPVVEVQFSDANGVALDREGIATEGAIAPSFTVARLEQASNGSYTSYHAYIVSPQTSTITGNTNDMPSSESNGTWEAIDAAAGLYRYTFATVLPDGFAEDRTHTIAAWGNRTVDGIRYVDDAWLNFRPDTQPVSQVREVVQTETCNNCHNPLALHGGQRLSVDLCITCHTPQGVDPDTANSIDMSVMIHKIHRGADLPSVQSGTPYVIIGRNNAPHDFSDVHFPHEINSCESCHTGADADRWNTSPSIAACGSCHDDIDFSLPTPDPNPSDALRPHPGGPKQDGTCTACHAPQSAGGLPGASVQSVHQRGRLNPSTPVLGAEIVSATNTGPAQTPVLRFRISVDGVGRDILTNPISRLSVVLGGPTTSIAGTVAYNPLSDDPSSATDQLVAVDAANGVFEYTFPKTLEQAVATFAYPTVAEGSFRIHVEARHAFDVPNVDTSGTTSVTVGAVNPVLDVAVTDPSAVARRTVVSTDKCNSCHRDLDFHGSNRKATGACVNCHNGNLDTFGRQPAPDAEDGGVPEPTETVRFGPMVHRIHGSQIATGDYVLFDNSGNPVDFSHVRYPGDAKACNACHEDGTQTLPLDDGLGPTRTREKNSAGMASGVVMSVEPTTSNCGGCHDSTAATVHAQLQTSGSGFETCVTCHGSGRVSDVDSAHARPEWEF